MLNQTPAHLLIANAMCGRFLSLHNDCSTYGIEYLENGLGKIVEQRALIQFLFCAHMLPEWRVQKTA